MQPNSFRMRADVILPAAGSSERMKLPVGKQFLKILGKHIIAYTVDCFHGLPWVRHIVIVVRSDQTEYTKQLMDSYGFDKVIVCAGERTRHRSIQCGVAALKSECTDSDIVLIHDAARPFVSEDIAVKIVEAAILHGAAGVTRPLVSTVIQPDDDQKLKESLDRRIYRNSEMPQAFQYRIIASAYEQCTDDDLEYGTECLLLAMKYSNCRAYLVEGTGDLWKVTYQKDLHSMEAVVKEKLMVVSIMVRDGAESQDMQDFRNNLSLRQIKLTSDDHDPANTFVIVLNSRASSTNAIDVLTSTITKSYARNPHSAIKLDLYVVLIFPFNITAHKPQSKSCVNSQTERTQVPCCHSFQNQSKNHSAPDLDNRAVAQMDNRDGLGELKSGASVKGKSFPKTCELQKQDSELINGDSESARFNAVFESDYKDCKLPNDSDHENCVKIVKDFKQRLVADNGQVSVSVVGIQCKKVLDISEELTNLVWERSFYLDGQVLTFV